ncbi:MULTISPECIES: ABC transporter permease [Bacteroidales]|jgi:lipoprotein-releasing system permease protein|uniref:ABC transporter permease n=1 Tax=Bacteroidales TaxID=171549 RepID=UPI000F477966|nr:MULTISPECIES: FtsX-like permease family protein [Bacteroidales]ROT03723.1 ABC transporter permease [Muribaculaceae bacterium Isolate-037 (Harlan)]
MNYAFFVSRHLSLSYGGNKKAPAIIVAVVAVALSVAVMIISISIVLGFKKEIRDKVIGFNSHITLFSSPISNNEDNIITLTPVLQKELNKMSFVTDYSLQAAIPAILKTNSDFKGTYLKGIASERSVEFLRKNLLSGEVVDFSNPENKAKIIISNKVASQLGLSVGDKIDTYFISDEIRVRRLSVVGVYDSHFDQYDDLMIFGSLSLIQQLGNIEDNQGTSLQINTDDFSNVQEYSVILQNTLNKAVAEGELSYVFHVENAYNQGVVYFSWLNLLDTNVVVVLILMMIVGCVTLVSGMLIIILEKKSFIGIMKALGASTSKIREIFIWLALRIALWGMSIGNIIAVTFIYMQRKTHFIPLDPDSYYIDFVPVVMSWESIVLLNIGVLFVVYCVLILPSRFVASVSPAQTMLSE